MSESMGSSLPLGSLVWAKMKGFSPWPGRVEKPPSTLTKKPKNSKSKCIYFFGSNNYAWIEEQNVQDYEAHKSKLATGSKNTLFREACLAIEDYKTKLEAGEVVNDYTSDDEALYGKGADSGVELGGNGSGIELPAKRERRGRKKKSTEENGESEEPEPPVIIKKARRRITETIRLSPTPISKSDTKADKGGPVEPTIDPEGHHSMEIAATQNNYTRKNTSFGNLLNRPVRLPAHVDGERTLDIGQASQTLKSKQITPSEMTFGFLGLGLMGSGIARNILQSGHKVVVWNRSPDKCLPFVEQGATQCQTPSDVVQLADITFSCVSDPVAARDLVFGNCGVRTEINTSKGYVEMTSLDAEASTDISEAILGEGGRYLEAAIQGSRNESEEGTLIIMGAGDRSLYNDCQSCFKAMGTHAFYLGDVGSASKMNMVLQLIRGINLAALAEGMALADRSGLDLKSVMDILNLTSMANKDFREKGQAIVTSNFATHFPLQHMQKDLNLAIAMSQMYDQPVPLAAAANEIYKHAKRLGYSEHDVSAVYVRARF